MQIGMVGLGRMGSNMAQRLLRHGHRVLGFDKDATHGRRLDEAGGRATASLDELARELPQPRIVWVMVPSGPPTEEVIATLAELLGPGDVVVDGGNSHYKDSIRRAAILEEKGIRFADAGTSGGVWGLERGYCLMVGGAPDTFETLEPILAALAPGRGTIEPTPGREALGGTAEKGYLHCGPVGAGHFVKMVHNGIEYGMMQAYAEGFDLLRAASSGEAPPDERFHINLRDVAEVWRRGSVIRSWLLDLTAAALTGDPELQTFEGRVPDSGEGRWTVQAAVERAVALPVISAALYTRFRSRSDNTTGEKLLSAMRHAFGGHTEPHGKK